MAQPTARARQADRRRSELLDVALRLFAERGFEATTIADISAAAGTAHGLVYHYFRSKDELLFAVLDRNSFLPSLRTLLAVAPNRPARDVLPEIAMGFSAMLGERADFLSLVARESQTNADVAAALGQIIGESIQLLAGYLESRIAAGELRPHDTAITARTIFQAIIGSHLSRYPASGFELGLIDVILHGVLAH